MTIYHRCGYLLILGPLAIACGEDIMPPQTSDSVVESPANRIGQNLEGALCTPAENTCGEGYSCIGTSSETASQNETGVCLISCQTDKDCADSSMAPAASFCSSDRVCVQALSSEGEFSQLSNIFVGCAPGTVRYSGRQHGLERQEFSCVRPCSNNLDCTTSGIGTCNVQQGNLTDNALPGICTEGTLRRAGASCSNRNATKSCSLDVSAFGHLLCLDLIDQFTLQSDSAGVCMQLCGDIDNNPATPDQGCTPQAANAASPICDLSALDSSGIGVCTDNCSAFPNSCSKDTPNSCSDFTGMCLEVKSETLPAFDVGLLEQGLLPSAEENCAGRENQCPADTFCAILDTPSSEATLYGACVYGCNPILPVDEQGCEGKTIGSASNLACIPFNQSAAPEIGFCQVQP